MNKKFEDQLVKDFPSIFRQYGGDPRETCMCWGLECGNGWYDIIRSLCQTITYHEKHLKRYDKEFEPVVFEQVKEKFGELRIYYIGGDDYVNGAVDMAVTMAAITCEACGKAGTLKVKGWMRVTCEECEKKSNN